MLKLLFNDCKNFAVRVTEDGFIKTCESLEVSPTRIARLNNIKEEPAVNSIIYVERKNSIFYRIKPDDSLRLIEEKFGVSKEEILTFNCVEYLYPFQLIEIPKECL